MNHVNSKLLIGLTCATLFAIAASAWLGYSKQAGQQPQSNQLIPGLAGHINDVKSLTIVGSDNQPLVSLDNSGNGWTVREKSGYPADTGKLRQLLLSLADAKLLQAKTSKPEHYAELGVEDVAGKDAKGLLLRLEGLPQPAKLIVGQVSSHGNGSFVRQPDQAQSWLASESLIVEKAPQQWLNTVLTDIAAQSIAEVVLTTADGKALRLFKDKAEESNFQVAGLPAGRELTAPGIANPLASALSNLQFGDVMPATAIPKTASKAHYRSFDGMMIEASLWQQDGKHLVQFTASLDSANNNQALQVEVKQLQQRFQGRQFAIAGFKYADMVKTQDDLLKPLENKPAEIKPAKSVKPAAPTSKAPIKKGS